MGLICIHHCAWLARFYLRRFSTKKTNYSASSMVAKCTFYLRLLSMIMPISTPDISMRFSDSLRILKPYSLSFIITFFFVSSNRSTFLSMVKYSLMPMYSRWDFCSLHLNLLFWRISISFMGSPIRSFSWVRLINA